MVFRHAKKILVPCIQFDFLIITQELKGKLKTNLSMLVVG
jgi:hypothetical protein